MGGVYLESRLEFLRQNQNPDGGWGYFPGKQSWFEPTAYAMLALHGAPDSVQPLDRAWALLGSWQCSDGSFRPSGHVAGGTWVTAHAVNLACVRGVYDGNVHRAVNWMLSVVGAEHGLVMRAAAYFHLLETKLDVSHEGWPWRDGNASWIEPTVHALVALKKVAAHYPSAELTARVREGEALVWSRRCADGGWNCGNPNVFDLDLPSYPETTGLALVGLQGWPGEPLAGPLEVARRFRAETKGSLAKAWLAIALRCYGRSVDAPAETPRASNDILLAALEALAHPDGNHRFFQTPGGLA
ncbi:MAG TPA: prenyltransferase/squalene oxidase repeat-containing protein [Bryobacteraceae bacterium]|nr:prenyltransferase/squalene oxidase repeat-containing protein [Bryobacteraceae bacterium]